MVVPSTEAGHSTPVTEPLQQRGGDDDDDDESRFLAWARHLRQQMAAWRETVAEYNSNINARNSRDEVSHSGNVSISDTATTSATVHIEPKCPSQQQQKRSPAEVRLLQDEQQRKSSFAALFPGKVQRGQREKSRPTCIVNYTRKAGDEAWCRISSPGPIMTREEQEEVEREENGQSAAAALQQQQQQVPSPGDISNVDNIELAVVAVVADDGEISAWL